MNYQKVYKYFIGQSGIDDHFFEKDSNGKKYTGKFVIDNKDCKLKSFQKIFGTTINCNNYETVVSGEGNEKEKIDTIYSSSLQSLLFFDKTNEHPIKIKIGGNELEFDEVVFEYKNKVIGYPSSIDVVLMNRDEKTICFIESKLLEIVRESSVEGKAVVGISYFQKNGIGYNQTLGLNNTDLTKIGICFPKDGPYLDRVKGRSGEKQPINSISSEETKFVYSEGIKQVLAHLIGISTFKNDSFYDKNSDPINSHEDFKHYYYIELYNKLPNFDGDELVDVKLRQFKDHFEIVKEIANKKGIVDQMEIMTYQELFKDNYEHLNDLISNFYHWKNT